MLLLFKGILSHFIAVRGNDNLLNDRTFLSYRSMCTPGACRRDAGMRTWWPWLGHWQLGTTPFLMEAEKRRTLSKEYATLLNIKKPHNSRPLHGTGNRLGRGGES